MTVDTHTPSAVADRVRDLCRQFKLPTLAAETVGRFSEAGHADALVTLVEVMEQEAEDRRVRRVDRLRRVSKLPAGKTWDTFEHDRTPVQLRQQLGRLGEGDFVDRGVNVLAFGMPRNRQDPRDVCHRTQTGGVRPISAVYPRIPTGAEPAPAQAGDMLAAKRDLELPRMLRKLDNFDLLVIDATSVPCRREPRSPRCCSSLIAERYERRSPGVTSNLVFSEWEKVFANPNGDRGGHRQDRSPLCHPGVRCAKLQDQCSAESSDRYGVRPARMIVARPAGMVDVEHHPLRIIRRVADDVLDRMSDDFERMYWKIRWASVPPECLPKALLQISIRSDQYGGVCAVLSPGR